MSIPFPAPLHVWPLHWGVFRGECGYTLPETNMEVENDHLEDNFLLQTEGFPIHVKFQGEYMPYMAYLGLVVTDSPLVHW